MELNRADNLTQETHQNDIHHGPETKYTVLDSWMNGLRKIFGKKKKPPRFASSEVSAPPTTYNMNELQNSMDEAVSSGLQQSRSMFGGHIEDLVDERTGVAKFVLWCVRAIETTGDALRTEGIYKIVGSQVGVDFIAQQYEEDMPACLAEEEDVLTLVGALKVFLRQLKIPLVDCREFSRIFQSQNAIGDTRLLMNSLPIPQRRTLCFLIHHLSSVWKLEKFNCTSLVELGVVFGPTLMRLPTDSQDMAEVMKQQNSIVEFLITNCDAIFPESCGYFDSGDVSDSQLDKDGSIQPNSEMREDLTSCKPRVPFKHTRTILPSTSVTQDRTEDERSNSPHPANMNVNSEDDRDNQSSQVHDDSSGDDVQKRPVLNKKSRSTPVDSYVPRASSDEETDSVDSDDSQQDVNLAPRCLPTAI